MAFELRNLRHSLVELTCIVSVNRLVFFIFVGLRIEGGLLDGKILKLLGWIGLLLYLLVESDFV